MYPQAKVMCWVYTEIDRPPLRRCRTGHPQREMRHFSLWLCMGMWCEYTKWTSVYREADMTKERIEKLLKAGANVVLTTKGIDDMALKASFPLCISVNSCSCVTARLS